MAVCGDLVARASGLVLSKIYIYKKSSSTYIYGRIASIYVSINNPITSTTEGTELLLIIVGNYVENVLVLCEGTVTSQTLHVHL